MAHIKPPTIPRPKRGLTDFERKIADILFAETSTNELCVERVLDVAIAISEGISMPTWKRVCPDVGQTILYKDGTDIRLQRFGYEIDLKELDKLPKED